MKKYLILSLTIALTLTWAHSYSLPKCETDNCQVCSSFGVCVMCRSDYMMVVNQETKVSQCIRRDCGIERCSRCLSEDICALCESGYVLDSEGSCVQISEGIIQAEKPLEPCLRKSFSGKCLQCIDSFDLSQGECYLKKLALSNLAGVACTTSIKNCISCLTPNYCTNCTGDLVPSADGLTCINNCRIYNCFLCATANTCGICNSGSTLQQNNTACIRCAITGCSLCSGNNVCSTCSFGYALNTTTSTCYLSNCQYPCATCGNNGQCTSCYPPFSPVPFGNGTCFTCRIPNCQSCNTTSCLQCYTGFVYNATTNTCNWGTPSPLCTAIDANGSCTQCIAGYTVISSTCIACQNAPICMICSSTNTALCTQCQIGYYVQKISNTCVACSYSNCAINSCVSAAVCVGFIPSSGLDVYTSTTLSTQTYFPYSCDFGCAQCASNYPTLCLLCSPGFYIFSSADTNNVSMCLPCSENCQTCSPNNPSQCLSCYGNSFLIVEFFTPSYCLTCDPTSNCLTCNSSNSSICTTCPFGYYLAVTTTDQMTYPTCQTPCPSGCLTCFNAGGTVLGGLNPNNMACSSCGSGFSLSVTGSCLPCISNCRVCSGSYQSICLQCGQGYYLNNNFTCQVCPASCLTCNQQGCLTCMAGYNLQVSQQSYNAIMVCVPVCNFPCASCLNNLPNNCTQCIFGYILSGSTCQLSSCVTNTTNACQNCPPGSVLINGLCNLCNGCARCSSNNTGLCLACFAGSFLYGEICLACPNRCQTCSSFKNCLTCAPGYTALVTPISVNSVICVRCTAPCAQCSNNPQFCISCINGFFLSGSNCLSNMYYTFTASFPVSTQVFFNNYQTIINQITYGLQTTNKYCLVVQSIQTSPSMSSIQITISTIQQSGSDNLAHEYQNLKFALGFENGYIGALPVTASMLEINGGEIVSTYSSVPMFCGIFIPVGIFVVVAVGYFVASRVGTDLPVLSYIPPASSGRERQITEMITL